MKDKISTFINFATIIGLIMGAYVWVEFRIDKTITERLKPYESLLAGLSLQENGSSELAIIEFRKVLSGIKPEELKEERLAAIIDPYLASIANSERPTKYESDFQKLLPLVKTKTGLKGDRYNSIGFIYLFSNRLQKAVESFEDSIAYYSMEKKSSEVGSSYWGLSLSYLALGKVEKAIEYYEKAWDIDYQNYGVENTFNYRITENDYGIHLVEMYPDFSPSINKFYDLLENTYEIKTITKRENLEK